MTVLESPPPPNADHEAVPGAGPFPPPNRRRSSARRRRLRVAAIILALALVPVAWSYGTYLTAPGDAPVSVRTVDWFRDHGFETVIDDVEQWWYTRHKPTGAAPPRADIPTALRHDALQPAADRAITAARSPSPSEAVWVPALGLDSGEGSVQQTFLHPDAAAPSVIATVVRFDQSKVRTVYVPGLAEPGGGWAWGSEVPPSERSKLIAAFNAGFKFRHTAGGVYTEGRHAVRPLEAGLASLVIDREGRADVIGWPGRAGLTPAVVSVRQNLALIADAGRPVAGLDSDRGLKWGTKQSQFQYTWRSAVGVDAQGRLIYAAGSQMTLVQLADAMVDAGAVRAMELDIHDGVVTFNWYRRSARSSVDVTGSKLTPSMQRSADRYLTPDQRDFIAIQAR